MSADLNAEDISMRIKIAKLFSVAALMAFLILAFSCGGGGDEWVDDKGNDTPSADDTRNDVDTKSEQALAGKAFLYEKTESTAPLPEPAPVPEPGPGTVSNEPIEQSRVRGTQTTRTAEETITKPWVSFYATSEAVYGTRATKSTYQIVERTDRVTYRWTGTGAITTSNEVEQISKTLVSEDYEWTPLYIGIYSVSSSSGKLVLEFTDKININEEIDLTYTKEDIDSTLRNSYYGIYNAGIYDAEVMENAYRLSSSAIVFENSGKHEKYTWNKIDQIDELKPINYLPAVRAKLKNQYYMFDIGTDSALFVYFSGNSACGFGSLDIVTDSDGDSYYFEKYDVDSKIKDFIYTIYSVPDSDTVNFSVYEEIDGKYGRYSKDSSKSGAFSLSVADDYSEFNVGSKKYKKTSDIYGITTYTRAHKEYSLSSGEKLTDASGYRSNLKWCCQQANFASSDGTVKLSYSPELFAYSLKVNEESMICENVCPARFWTEFDFTEYKTWTVTWEKGNTDGTINVTDGTNSYTLKFTDRYIDSQF